MWILHWCVNCKWLLNHNMSPSGWSWRWTTRPAGPSWTCRSTSVFHVPGGLLSSIFVLFFNLFLGPRKPCKSQFTVLMEIVPNRAEILHVAFILQSRDLIPNNLNPFRFIHLWTLFSVVLLFLLKSPLQSRCVKAFELYFFFNASVIFRNETIRTHLGPKMKRLMPVLVIIPFYGWSGFVLGVCNYESAGGKWLLEETRSKMMVS